MKEVYYIKGRTMHDTVIITLRGDLSYGHGTIEFRRMMRYYLGTRWYRKFIIHFGGEKGVQSIDSSFIGELFYFTNEVGNNGGNQFILVNLSDSVRASLEVTEMIDKLTIVVDDECMGRF